MYHCHFEETEHVHMGMIGPAYIRPLLNQTLAPRKFVYNHDSTEYDREFVMVLSEIWSEAHWADSHIQLPEWTDYAPDIFLLNGRSYPDTLAPNGGIDLGHAGATGNMIAPDGRPELAYQPVSSLVRCKAGDRVLLRLINLGFTYYTMELTGIKMRVVGRDATLLRNGATDLSFSTTSVGLGPGETADAIFIAPPFNPAYGSPNKYLFYNRHLAKLNTSGFNGHGGHMTEVWVYEDLPPQENPNE
jgi:FtsP/CotA-like multicopper oxidase with cupredoxin domain